MKPECKKADRWALQQSGRTYQGHWHGRDAVCDDGTVFRAGEGWLGFGESQRLIATLCGRRMPLTPQYPASSRHA